MRIAIVVPDKLVAVDSAPLTLPDLDWSVFSGGPTPYDDIHAVHFDTQTGQGHVEYAVVVTKEPTRPNIKPGDWPITITDFESRFSWVLAAYADRTAAIKQEMLEAEAAAARAAQAEQEGTTVSVTDPATAEELARVRSELDALKDSLAAAVKDTGDAPAN